jgi:hypothetical protein
MIKNSPPRGSKSSGGQRNPPMPSGHGLESQFNAFDPLRVMITNGSFHFYVLDSTFMFS